jgi:hypothetical protein
MSMTEAESYTLKTAQRSAIICIPKESDCWRIPR